MKWKGTVSQLGHSHMASEVRDREHAPGDVDDDGEAHRPVGRRQSTASWYPFPRTVSIAS